MRPPWRSVALAVIAVVAVAVSGLVGGGGTPAQAAQAETMSVPASVSGWDAGNIISDDVFFAKDSMTAAQVQEFLNSKVPSCQSGYTCLKDYRITTASRAADAMCRSPYQGAANERSADIIVKVAQACGINPRVLLVMLQKEQGLVTHTWPSDWRYTIAMGQGCPDTAACDTQYYGLFNQLYGAAWQLKRYANPPGTSNFFTWYAPGRTWNIQWSPNASCGSGPVAIANQATADLYYYTPYQPNAAALAAGSGEGDACSAYGNRNFYNYFTDWFGSTRSQLGAAITDQYAAMGGAGGFLGASSGGVTCGLEGGGCYQNFAGGVIYWSTSTGAWTMTEPIRSAWNSRDYERGLGYPTGPQRCGLVDGGCVQDFQRGVIYRSANGSHAVEGAVRAEWNRLDYERGLGYPTAAMRCDLAGGACLQDFQRGTIYQSTFGAFAIQSPIGVEWARLDYERGLGYPVRAQQCGLTGGGCFQDFERGVVYTSSAGTYAISGGVRDAWSRADYERGLGYPTGAQVCEAGGDRCSQSFQSGVAYSIGAQGAALSGAMAEAWTIVGGEGVLGYPSGDRTCLRTRSVCFQDFEQGVLYQSGAGTYAIQGAIRTEWSRLDYERGLGLPTASAVCGLAGGACTQTFENGVIAWSSATGAHAVKGAVLAGWRAAGAESGLYGLPTADASCTSSSCRQQFQGGALP